MSPNYITPTAMPTAAPSIAPSFSPTEIPSESPSILTNSTSSTTYVTCTIEPIATREDFGRIPDPGNESVINPVAGVPFQVSCSFEMSAFDSITSFNLATTTAGDFYYNGAVVTSVPGSEFIADGSGGFNLIGLEFVPGKDVSFDDIVTHSIVTTRSDTGPGDTRTIVQNINICSVADIPTASVDTGCANIAEDTEGALFVNFVINDMDGSEIISTYETSVISPVEYFSLLNRGPVGSGKNMITEARCNICPGSNYYLTPAEHISGNLYLTVRVRFLLHSTNKY